MVVSRRVVPVHVVAGVPVVATVTGGRGRADRRRLSRAQHGSRHRAPDGEQGGEQDQDEGAEVLHEQSLSGSGSVHAAPRKFPGVTGMARRLLPGRGARPEMHVAGRRMPPATTRPLPPGPPGWCAPAAIPVAAAHEVFEGCLHRQQLRGLLLQLVDVHFGQGVDLPARPKRLGPPTVGRMEVAHRIPTE